MSRRVPQLSGDAWPSRFCTQLNSFHIFSCFFFLFLLQQLSGTLTCSQLAKKPEITVKTFTPQHPSTLTAAAASALGCHIPACHITG